jgi:hypothetical protein
MDDRRTTLSAKSVQMLVAMAKNEGSMTPIRFNIAKFVKTDERTVSDTLLKV